MHRPPRRHAPGIPGCRDLTVSLACAVLALGPCVTAPTALSQPFELALASPALDRWVYPHNATPGSRPTAPVFGTLGDESGVDSRHGQFLVGFDLSSQVPTNLGPRAYLIRHCRLSATISRDRSFILDPTTDGPATYLPTNHPDLVPDPDLGRPIEVFGVGYRNGFTQESFVEDSPFGNAAIGLRNAFSAGFASDGTLVDVGNNVGKTNAAFPTFEAFPFAVGTSETVRPGDLVPAGTRIDFDLNLADPLVVQYLQQACHSGHLRLMLTSLQTSGFGGQPAWSEFHTRESVLGDPPRLILSGTAVRTTDSDEDHLPDDWEQHVFGSLIATDSGDDDLDGLANLAEWDAGTDPRNSSETLSLERVNASADGATVLRFRHAPSRRYSLLRSQDLRAWEPMTTSPLQFELGTGWAHVVLPADPPLEATFFRVAAEPLAAAQP